MYPLWQGLPLTHWSAQPHKEMQTLEATPSSHETDGSLLLLTAHLIPHNTAHTFRANEPCRRGGSYPEEDAFPKKDPWYFAVVLFIHHVVDHSHDICKIHIVDVFALLLILSHDQLFVSLKLACGMVIPTPPSLYYNKHILHNPSHIYKYHSLTGNHQFVISYSMDDSSNMIPLL